MSAARHRDRAPTRFRPIQPYALPLLGAAVCQNDIDVKCENDGWSYPTPCTNRQLALVVQLFHAAHRLVPADVRVDFSRSFSLMPIVGDAL